MIVHKMWIIRGEGKERGETWWREGWFLFGFILLYARTTKHEYPVYS